MRRPLRLALAILLLLVLAYGGFWYWAAGEARRIVEGWAEARRAEGYTVVWRDLAVGGFPLALRVALTQPVLGREATGYEASAAEIVASTRPWAFREWQIEAEKGAKLAIASAGSRPAITATAGHLGATLAPQPEAPADPPGTILAFAGENFLVEGGTRVTIERLSGTALLPRRAAAGHLETWSSATLDGHGIGLPTEVKPLGRSIDALDASIAVKGAIPGGERRAALNAWREDGGTVELESLDLAWGPLKLAGKGELALDAALQPEGAFTATIRGYAAILDALSGGGALKPGDATVAKIALGLLAKPGTDGTPEITAPVTVQNQQLFLGPARLARLPQIDWE